MATYPIGEVPLNIADALSTIGIQVRIIEKPQSGDPTYGQSDIVKWAHDVGDLGGTPETLDATPLASMVQMNKSGIQAQDQFNITYYYNDTDYALLDSLVNKKVCIQIAMNNGTTVFNNTGTVTANYVTALSVNAVSDAQATIDLDGKWTKATVS